MRNRSLLRASARLLAPYKRQALAAALTGGAASLATVGVLAMIERALGNGLAAAEIAIFAGLCATTLAGEIVANRSNSEVVQGAVADLRKELVDKILCAPVAALERLQRHRIVTALNHDVDEICEFVRGLPFLFVSVLTALGCAAYLVFLSWRLALVAFAFAGLPIYLMRRALSTAFVLFDAERRARDELQKDYDALIEGAKELRLNRARRAVFRNDRLFARIERIRDLTTRNFVIFSTVEAIDTTSIFIVIGGLTAAQTALGETPATTGTFIVALLYMRAPVNAVIAHVAMFGRAATSFRRVVDLSESFTTAEPRLVESAAQPPSPFFGSVELRGVTFQYSQEENVVGFTLGPTDLHIRPGEIVFIVGENGGGKTTLLKLILGVYPPTSGEILVDGRPVCDAERDDYRQLFSAVFFDYFLFDDVSVSQESATAAQDYLALMEISEKTAIENGVYTTTALSAGQRKRLALVSAFAEGRPVMVFDEWAAEQDPAFRRAFYREILPDLKRRGKTLVIISHDDRYFDAADRIVTISGGKISAEA
ncbi:pyoverdine biosynthesis protein PvdE [Methylosinus sp. C49]|uniref:cyclic peptide export ABC transporter n=1 Tax=Methylosinus sp. C49 TaxID=2699395 RepID=UPI001367306C|nr:cyclic peptide export ABC transporter [Methylosinus sp. C49]BBU63609.1 pyoverdine biosynthesis protein PvdE [Methylosinus sp. C49]